MKDNYHHGNLKQELINTGIRIINTEGGKVVRRDPLPPSLFYSCP